MPPQRAESPRVTAELIAFHTRRGRALQRAAIAAAARALLRWRRAALNQRR